MAPCRRTLLIVVAASFFLSGCIRRQKILVPTISGKGAVNVTNQQPEYYSLNEYTVQKCFYDIASLGLSDPTSSCPDFDRISQPASSAQTLKGQAAAELSKRNTQGSFQESPDRANKFRNAIVFGLMTDIDLVYNYQYNNLFVRKNMSATIGDGITLGLGATGAIAAQKATKTIMAALQTAFTGLNASISKNYFAEQSFQVLGMAMTTRRDKVRKGILEGLAKEDDAYPLNQAKRDLISYAQAGTLPAALEELQQEAGVASRDQKKLDPATIAASAPTDLTANRGILANALEWRPVSGASAYTVYWSTISPVTKESPKLLPLSSNNVLDKRPNTAKIFYAVSATVSGQESDLSTEVSATPVNIASDPAAKLPAPTSFRALANAGTVLLTFDAPENSVTFIVRSSSDNKGSEAKSVGEQSDSNLVLVKVPNADKLFYQVTAVNRNGAAGTPTDWISPTAQPSADKKKPTGVSLY